MLVPAIYRSASRRMVIGPNNGINKPAEKGCTYSTVMKFVVYDTFLSSCDTRHSKAVVMSALT